MKDPKSTYDTRYIAITFSIFHKAGLYLHTGDWEHERNGWKENLGAQSCFSFLYPKRNHMHGVIVCTRTPVSSPVPGVAGQADIKYKKKSIKRYVKVAHKIKEASLLP